MHKRKFETDCSSFSFRAFNNLFLVPTKLLPLSQRRSLFPLLPTNLLKLWMKASVSIDDTLSRWTALLQRQVKIILYFFRVLLLSLMWNGPKMSTPTYVNGGASFIRSGGRLAIFWVVVRPRRIRQETHFEIMCRTSEFPLINQNPFSLIRLIVAFLPLWWTSLWA